MLLTGLLLQGVLITYQNGTAMGRQRYRDDGSALVSEVELGGRHTKLTLTRKPRRVHLEGAAEQAVPPDTVVLENGDWQAYALAAEWAGGAQPAAVHVLVPSAGQTVDGKIQVVAHDGGKTVTVSIGGMAVTVEVAASGAVVRASVPAQRLEARPEGEAPPKATAAPAAKSRPPGPGIAAEPVALERAGATIRGELWRPEAAKGKLPLAILIAGSGPTDLDGNSRMGLWTDCYRMLAEALVGRGVAVLRYDKRGIRSSAVAALDESKLTIADYVDDAAGLVARARQDARFGPVTIIGHSEGGLVALLLAQKTPVDALVLLATAGRPLAAVVHEQLARQGLAEEGDRLFAAMRKGEPIAAQANTLKLLFRPSVLPFLRSESDIDPVALVRPLKQPLAIIQGVNDLQVSVADAKRLAAARADAKLTLLDGVNHVLKAETERELGQASYSDPTRSLGAGLVDAVAAGIKR